MRGSGLRVVTQLGNCREEFKVDWLALESLPVACLGKGAGRDWGLWLWVHREGEAGFGAPASWPS